jgi:hypothetical protein
MTERIEGGSKRRFEGCQHTIAKVPRGKGAGLLLRAANPCFQWVSFWDIQA